MHDPTISPEVYFLRKSVALSAVVNKRTAIYLDTKFWLKLRDIRLGTPQESLDTSLEARLTTLVAEGKVICPFAADIFSELLRAGDPAKRLVSAKLVDELSLGLTLRTEQERVFTELEFYLQGRRKRTPTVLARDKMWTCPAYVVGFNLPEHSGIDPTIQAEIQKSFMDHLYTLGFLDLAKSIADNRPRKRDPSLAGKLNELNRQNAAGMISFEQVYKEEFRGAIQHHFSTIADVLRAITEAETGHICDAEALEKAKHSALILGATIVKDFEAGEIGLWAPTLLIRAGLCAATRWDRGRLYKDNDFHDHSHAAAALPYFDVFATEISLAHLAHQLKFDERYETKVVKTSEELLKLLSTL